MPAWKTCHNGTAVKHLDVDAPRVLRGLYEQQVNDVWQHRSVQCSAGDYISDDYCAPARPAVLYDAVASLSVGSAACAGVHATCAQSARLPDMRAQVLHTWVLALECCRLRVWAKYVP